MRHDENKPVWYIINLQSQINRNYRYVFSIHLFTVPSFTWQTVSFLFVPVPLLDKLESTDCTSEASASAVADGLSERFPKLPYKEEKSKTLKQDTSKGQSHCKKIITSTLIKRSFNMPRDTNILGRRWTSLPCYKNCCLTDITFTYTSKKKVVYFTLSRHLLVSHQASSPNSQGI